MRFCPQKIGAALACLLLIAIASRAQEIALEEPLETVRSEDRIVLHAGRSYLTLSQTIVLSPIKVPGERLKPGAPPNVVHVLISSVWLRDGTAGRPAFPMLRPHINLSHGRVRRLALVQPDGEPVRHLGQMTPESKYVLSLEFGHVIPKQFTVNVNMSASSGITPDMELLYTASNDAQPFRSGPPESFYTTLRVVADPSVAPWDVVQGDRRLPREGSSSVRLDRNVSHTIRFGARAE